VGERALAVLQSGQGVLQSGQGIVQSGQGVVQSGQGIVQSGQGVDVYESQWAGGSDRLARVLDTSVDPICALAAADWEYRGRWPAPAVSRRVDALATESVYHVSVGGVRVYLPVWLGFTWPGERVTGGVLLRVDTREECRRLRATVRFLKSVFHEAIGRDWLDPPGARDLLALALRTYCPPTRIHTPGTPL
jgi:hypothetical protein